MATLKAQGVLFPHIHSARSLSLTCKAFRLLLLLGALLAEFVPMPAWAQTFTHTQITNSTGGPNTYPSINSNGTRIAFVSNRDLTGGNPDLNSEIFLWTQGLGFTQITNSPGDRQSWSPSINADGTRIAFESDSDLTGGNPDGGPDIFLWTQGLGIAQITTGVFGSHEPSINADGTRIAFDSSRDLTPGSPGNADGNQEIFLWTSGSGFTQITNSTGGDNFRPSINADGTRIAFDSDRDLTGGNADGNLEIFLWTSGSGITQITNTTGGSNLWPSINADGTRIAFDSSRDLTGGNPDGNHEIFLWTSGAGFTQITSSTAGYNGAAFINADGTRIAFVSNKDLTPGSPGNADGNYEIFLASGASASIPTLSELAQIVLVTLLLGAMPLALRKKGQLL